MKKIKILIFIMAYLPGNKAGGPIQSIKNMTKLLGDKIDFTIVTQNNDFGEEVPYENIETGKIYYLDKSKVIYLEKKDFLSFKKIREICNSGYDYIYTNMSFIDYTRKLLILNKLNMIKPKLIVAPRGEYSGKALELKATKKQIFLKIANLIGLYKDVIWHATTEDEAKEIKKNHKYGMIRVASNLKEKVEVEKINNKKENSLNLVFISRISPKKNIFKCLTLLKDFDKKNITFDIYGPIEDENYWKECQRTIKKLKNVVVNYKGFIKQEEVVKTLSKYDFFFFPTLGENFGHIILESLIAKTPLIISDQTPWKNIKKQGLGWDLELLDENFIEIINKCYQLGNEEYLEMVNSIENYIKNYDQTKSIKDNIDLFSIKS